MTYDKPQLFLTQFIEKTDRNGNQFFYGQLGALNVAMFRSKTDHTKWNLLITQKEKKEKTDNQNFNQNQNNFDDGFGF